MPRGSEHAPFEAGRKEQIPTRTRECCGPGCPMPCLNGRGMKLKPHRLEERPVERLELLRAEPIRTCHQMPNRDSRRSADRLNRCMKSTGSNVVKSMRSPLANRGSSSRPKKRACRDQRSDRARCDFACGVSSFSRCKSTGGPRRS